MTRIEVIQPWYLDSCLMGLNYRRSQTNYKYTIWVTCPFWDKTEYSIIINIRKQQKYIILLMNINVYFS